MSFRVETTVHATGILEANPSGRVGHHTNLQKASSHAQLPLIKPGLFLEGFASELGLSENIIEENWLREHSGYQDLNEVQEISLSCNTSSQMLNTLGMCLPNLFYLDLSGSILKNLRFLGTGYEALEVLKVSQCSLESLAGITSFPHLKELYASFNRISDLSDLRLTDAPLEILDLEGNAISDIKPLRGVKTLTSLNLEGNPVALHPENQPNLREFGRVLETLEGMNEISNGTKESSYAETYRNIKAELLKRLQSDDHKCFTKIKRGSQTTRPFQRPAVQGTPRPLTAMPLCSARESPSRFSPTMISSTPRCLLSDRVDPSSELTQKLVCGSPINAIRTKRRLNSERAAI